jgi:hypothetical protein
VTTTREQFFVAVEESRDALEQLGKCKPKELKKISKASQQGEQATKVMHTFFREAWVRRYGSTRPNPFHPMN